MRFEYTLQNAVTALKTNKVRTFLTMLGIIIGVFSVVLLVSLVRGVENYITDQFNSIGSNLVFIAPGRAGISKDPASSFTDNKLDESHVSLLHKNGIDFIKNITPLLTAGKTIEYKDKKYFSMVNGSYANYKEIFNIELDKGGFYNDTQSRAVDKIVVLGSVVSKDLFGEQNPVGKVVSIDRQPFVVVGTLKSKGQDFDDRVVVPYETASKILKIETMSYITVQLESDADYDLAIRKIGSILRRVLAEDDFTIMTQKDLLSSIQSILQILSFGIGAVAAISLLVGGIGIMNIMLVAVTERIREIGLRKALGATRFNIALQFLMESVMLSIMGGVVGLISGFIGSLYARRFVRTETPLWVVFLSIGFSILIGVVFGTYPAIKASKKDAIEALRYE